MNKYIYFFNLILMLSLTVSCAKEKIPGEAYQNSTVSSDIEIAAEEIRIASGVALNLDGLKVFEYYEETSSAARCTGIGMQNQSAIGINTFRYNKHNQESKIAIMIHELGHCYFGLPHYDVGYEDHRYDLMNTNMYFALKFNFDSPEKRAPYIQKMIERGMMKSFGSKMSVEQGHAENHEGCQH